MDPRQLTRALRFDTGAYGQTLVAVVDGNGRVIARSREEDRFIGAPVPTWNALLDVNAPSGIFKAELLEGDTITFAFSTIPGTPGWVVVAGVPSAILDTRWGEPLRYFVGGSIAAVLAGAGLALLVASRIARPLSALAAYAETTTGGTPGTPPGRTPISEYETLRDTLIEAQHRLLDRANRLAVSEARYRAVAKIGAVVTWRQSVSGDLFELEGWEDLTGRPAEPMLGNGWTRTIHPDDLPSITEQWRASLASLAPLDFECRVQLAESDWLYVRVRGTCLRDATGAPAEWAGTVENIHARKLRELRDYHLAFHDELTDLPNRGLMRERLDLAMMAACEGKLGALLYVDLDYFKQANDTYGHAMGDALLRAVAQRLRGLLRAGDTAARIGGDEFAVVLADIDDLGAATATGARIVRSLSSPFELDGATIRIGASIGIALVDGQVPVAEVQKRADMALYGAKGAGRNRYAVYDPDRYERRLA